METIKIDELKKKNEEPKEEWIQRGGMQKEERRTEWRLNKKRYIDIWNKKNKEQNEDNTKLMNEKE